VIFLIQKLHNTLAHVVRQKVDVNRTWILLPAHSLSPEREKHIRKRARSSKESDVLDPTPRDTVGPMLLT
jgi:hypothetical protein